MQSSLKTNQHALSFCPHQGVPELNLQFDPQGPDGWNGGAPPAGGAGGGGGLPAAGSDSFASEKVSEARTDVRGNRGLVSELKTSDSRLFFSSSSSSSGPCSLCTWTSPRLWVITAFLHSQPALIRRRHTIQPIRQRRRRVASIPPARRATVRCTRRSSRAVVSIHRPTLLGKAPCHHRTTTVCQTLVCARRQGQEAFFLR